MNQILMTKDENEAVSNEIKPIIKFFAIVIIVVALIFIGEGGYKLYEIAGKDTSFTKPVLSYEQNGSAISISLDSEIGINKIEYFWNEGSVTTVKGTGKTDIDFEIEIPQGDNTLSISVTDVEGNKTSFDKIAISFNTNSEENIDTIKPEVSIVNTVGKITINATDETELDYITYKWEDEDEVKVTTTEKGQKSITQELTVQKGTKKLTITAVDKTGNKSTISKNVIGSDGPQIKVTIADDNFVVKVTDEYKITKIEYTINDVEHTVENIPENAKEFEFRVPLEEGVNYLKINAYENELMTEYKCKKTK